MPLAITQQTLKAAAHEVARFDGESPALGLATKREGVVGSGAELDTAPTEFTANLSPKNRCFRLVHDGSKVIALFEGVGTTMTRNELFCGTEEECNAEVERLGLTPLPAAPPAPAPSDPTSPRSQRLRDRAAQLLQQADAIDTKAGAQAPVSSAPSGPATAKPG